MMFRKIAVLCLALMALSSCKKEVNHEEVVSAAAKQYYSYLLSGDYESFVDGTWHADSLRPAYRLQLLENAKMFMAQQRKEHGGIKDVEVKTVDVDSLLTRADVFLELSYGDGGREEVLLPMVCHDGLWYLR